MSDDEIAVVHDFFSIRGGGERLVLDLAAGLDAALAYAYWEETSYPRSEFSGLTIHDLEVGRAPPGLRIAQLVLAYRRRAAFLERYRRVVYSGDFAPFAMNQHRRGGNIWYCHTPARLVYDQRAFLLSRVPVWQRPLLRMVVAYLERAYPTLAAEMDLLVANSVNVRRRIQRYWGREAEVIYPPCDTRGFRWLAQGDYYLSTARLEPLKRVDVLVEAFRRMPGSRLVIASGGSESSRLRRMAEGAENIHFVGWVDSERLRRLVGESIATLYIPRDEDFGMSPVESMAAGKPVIGVAEGGLLETVVPGETGVLVEPPPSAEAIIGAVEHLSAARALEMREACERRARRFGKEVFLDSMRGVLQRV